MNFGTINNVFIEWKTNGSVSIAMPLLQSVYDNLKHFDINDNF